MLSYLYKELNHLFLWRKMKEINAEDVFTSIYQSNIWGGKKSVSGKGSDALQAGSIIQYLPEVFSK